jgi:hypothetical protein
MEDIQVEAVCGHGGRPVSSYANYQAQCVGTRLLEPTIEICEVEGVMPDHCGAGSGVPANVMSLIQSAKINDLDPQAYLRDVLERLPTAKYSEIDSLLPHNWSPALKV